MTSVEISWRLRIPSHFELIDDRFSGPRAVLVRKVDGRREHRNNGSISRLLCKKGFGLFPQRGRPGHLGGVPRIGGRTCSIRTARPHPIARFTTVGLSEPRKSDSTRTLDHTKNEGVMSTMPRIPLSNIEGNVYERLMGHRPEILKAWFNLDTTMRFSGALGSELKEEVRWFFRAGGRLRLLRESGRRSRVTRGSRKRSPSALPRWS